SQWSYSINGMYQIMPERAWGFNVAAAVNGHEGYAAPYFLYHAKRTGFTNTSNTNVLATSSPDAIKLDNVNVLDLRLEKPFKFDRFGLTVGVDVFNALNANTVLQRQLRTSGTNVSGGSNVTSNSGDYVYEVLSPRIFRVGATISFN
ncbi:MAG TPA: hypothetical protein VKC62_01770, partial [Gaiellaceae bacterium]|nr:hypothetical protein [Gaiellaceae bacterium]